MPTERVRRSVVWGLGAFWLFQASSAQAEDAVRFFVRAFIPKSHPTQPGAIKLKFPRQQPEFSSSINHLRWIVGLGF